MPPGWDRWYVPVDHTEYRMYGYRLNENGKLRTYGTRHPTTRPTSRAQGAGVRPRQRPRSALFLTVGTTARHLESLTTRNLQSAAVNPTRAPRPRWLGDRCPLRPPRSTNQRLRQADIRAPAPRLNGPQVSRPSHDLPQSPRELLAVDDIVRGLVHELRATGELDGTYIVFTSDNGFMLGPHHRMESKPCTRSRSGSGWSSVARGCRGTGPRPARREHRPGARHPRRDGVRPRLRMDGFAAPPADDPAVAGTALSVLEYLAGPHGYSAVRTPDGFVYVEYRDGERELYDLNTDPLRAPQPRRQVGRRRAPSETRACPCGPSPLRWLGPATRRDSGSAANGASRQPGVWTVTLQQHVLRLGSSGFIELSPAFAMLAATHHRYTPKET